ncbi:hypothetical protein Acsp05_23520 [Actinokineospora sp. NBRC 105648]|nr:hypothetical protein Acsp05_23520 [Actinokineospora sp. NBRC 105648]
MFDESGDALRALTEAITRLHVRAGCPAPATVAEFIGVGGYDHVISADTVHRILNGKPARWGSVRVLALTLAQLTLPTGEIPDEVVRIRALWDTADRAARSARGYSDPALLREAKLGLSGRGDPVSLFQRALAYVPVSADRSFLISPTARAGVWMCAFTTQAGVREHRPRAVPAWDGAHLKMRGDELIRRVCALPISVGLLVDPDEAAREAMPLPHHVIVALNAGRDTRSPA